MQLEGKVVVVTGGASGIGRGLARRFGAEGAAGVVVADVNADGAAAVAAEIAGAGGVAMAVPTNVAIEAEVIGLVERAEATYGPIDLFCANAGIGLGTGPETPDDAWERIWQVNTMAHVYAARALLPGWLARGEGYFLATASAAGLLTQIGSAPYAVTKHAAVAFAEWLAVTYGDQGVRVSCLCPQGVRTGMFTGDIRVASAAAVRAGGAVLEPEDVAEAVVAAIAAEQFLVLPHPEVLTYWRRKTDDYDRWLNGMRRLQARVGGDQQA
jgi:NAD(P)-dependent dehydrogenase (short-subunit alcohol dehydrogenase family)